MNSVVLVSTLLIVVALTDASPNKIGKYVIKYINGSSALHADACSRGCIRAHKNNFISFFI